MKYIPFLVFLIFSAPAAGSLYIEKVAGTQYYGMFGDMDNIRAKEIYKSHVPSTMTAVWPSKNGIWIIFVFPGVAWQDPIYLGQNLLPTDNADAVLGQLVNSQLAGGIIMPLVTTASFKSLIFMVCDYKTNTMAMTCKMATTAGGEITPPPPEEETLSCSITGTIELHHGSLTLETVANNSAQTAALVSCNRNASVSLSIEGMVKLNGVEGLYSQLTVGGAPVGQPYKFTAGTTYTPVDFKSVLRTVGTVTPGDFSGSAKVELAFP
ncbi:MrpH family fimbial adhesin [Pseudomonas donghuensis]|uniref:Fimbrial adhesin MrpH C-terminal domain-containing protein n=1 Tax=Pseudomonas donghuensis TaxID=1163398 RepID=A0AAQ0INL3_9PSED|nr:hypothetical protein [Pseudomonas donghuensis]MCP6690164.1 hypothetical protein [Pseudomonas donghuensis]MDF9896052.1 hypothetical protein [Pseudomonas vranovensis]QWE81370.1 hypothetical protein BV82_26240 [Pseudomonas donghuensis]